MSAKLKATILGCGSSGGVPRLGGPEGAGLWGACNPQDPRNRRRRCSLLLERETLSGERTQVVIDTGPDLRQQLLDAQVSRLDSVIYTHDHADHTHGLDDLRLVVFNIKRRLPIWADARTRDILFSRFGYAFETPPGSEYPPILEFNLIEKTGPGAPAIVTDGPGGPIAATPFDVRHGRINALGFRIGSMAYIPDIDGMTEAAWAACQDLDVLILDCLRYTPHPSHANLEMALEWIEQLKPKRAILTNLHIDLDFETLQKETPAHVEPAYDGLVVEMAD